MTTNTFAVWCTVRGGVTGWREAWLKSNGKICYFDTRAKAEAEASRLNRAMNGTHARARFCYSAKEVGTL
jgi:hypothetical protein